MSGFGTPPPDAAVYVISVAAELTGLHPQTLRTYERMGLITPRRTGGGGRRYSTRDLELLRRIADLTREGIGLEGVRRILALDRQVTALRARNAELEDELEAAREALRGAVLRQRAAVGQVRGDRLPVLADPVGSQLVLWRRSSSRMTPGRPRG